MKKLINKPEDGLRESLMGMAAAHADAIKVHFDPCFVYRADAPVRGKAQVGDKTMVDALVPGVEAFEKAVKAGHDTAAALQQAVAATKQGMKDTISLRARKGRASYLGERSVGHQDPGATSTFLMLKTLLDAVSSKGT